MSVVESLVVRRYSADRYAAIVDFEWSEANGDLCGWRVSVPVWGFLRVVKPLTWGVLSLTDQAGLRAEVSVGGRSFVLPMIDGDVPQPVQPS